MSLIDPTKLVPDAQIGTGIGGLYTFRQPRPYVPLKNVPPPLDPRLSRDDPRQRYNNCHTTEAWMAVIKKIIDATWVKEAAPGDKVNFTHDYSLIGENPADLAGVVVVYETLSRMPAVLSTKTGRSIRQIKPSVRQVLPNGEYLTVTGSNAVSVLENASDDMTWIYAQSFDTVQMFTVYGDTWSRMYEYLAKFEDLMTVYAGVFIQGGLQQFCFQQTTRNSLYNPTKTEAFPNTTLFYRARIERQTKINLSTLRSVIVEAGILNELTGTTEVELVQNVLGQLADPAPIELGPNDSL